MSDTPSTPVPSGSCVGNGSLNTESFFLQDSPMDQLRLLMASHIENSDTVFNLVYSSLRQQVLKNNLSMNDFIYHWESVFKKMYVRELQMESANGSSDRVTFSEDRDDRDRRHCSRCARRIKSSIAGDRCGHCLKRDSSASTPMSEPPVVPVKRERTEE